VSSFSLEGGGGGGSKRPRLYTLPIYDFDLRATHARAPLPAALAPVSFGFVLVRVRVPSRNLRRIYGPPASSLLRQIHGPPTGRTAERRDSGLGLGIRDSSEQAHTGTCT
jgi:hypothetical protein